MPWIWADQAGWISLKNIFTPFWKSKSFQEANAKGEDWFSLWHNSGLLKGFDSVVPGLGSGLDNAYGKIADANWPGTNKQGGEILFLGTIVYLGYRYLK